MKSVLMVEAWKIEGEIFKLHLKSDKCNDLNEAVKLKKKINLLTARHQQYLKILNEFKGKKRFK